MQPIFTARQRAAQRATAEASTQTTGAIRSVRLMNTGPLQPIVNQPPAVAVIHIGSVLPSLLELTDVSALRTLNGFRMAYLHQHIELNDATYVVRAVYHDPLKVGRILARVERAGEDA